jgi:CRP-like cAMP-binding protein
MVNKSRPPTKFSAFRVTVTETTSTTRSCSTCPKEFEMLFPKLEFVRLKTHHVLHEPGDSLKSAYFCNTGLISILIVLPDGKSVEVGLVGKKGFIGLPLVAGFRTAPTRAVTQVEGSAFRVDGETLTTILLQAPKLERRLQQFAQILGMQGTPIAACNRLHEVNERLARWLLMSADRIGSRGRGRLSTGKAIRDS